MNKKFASLQRTIKELSLQNKGKKVAKTQKNVRAMQPIRKTQAAPKSVAYTTGSSQPRFSSQASGVRVSHREMFADFKVDIAAIPFQTNSFYANPGQQSTFPWLSVIAQQFEMYEFTSLSFTYVPSMSTEVMGKMMIAFDYDASDEPPLTKVEASSLHPSVENSVWSSQTLPIPMKKSSPFGNGRRYVRSGLQPPNTDIKTYDLGFVMFFLIDVSSAQLSAGQVAGDLWVDYTVNFYKPQININQIALNLSNRHGALDPSIALPFGTAPDTYGGLLPIRIQNVGSGDQGRIFFDKIGTYLVNLVAHGTGFTSYPTLILPSGITSYDENYWLDGTTDLINRFIIKVLEAGKAIVLDFTGVATTMTELGFSIATYTDHTISGE